MISLIEPTYKTNLWVSPIAPIYKIRARRKPNQNVYLKNKKPKVAFKEVLDIEMSMGLGSKFSARA